MLLAVLTLWALNIFDAAMTWYGITAGYARESNPLMELALTYGPYVFFGAKIALVTFACFALVFGGRRHPSLKGLAIGLDVLYGAVAAWHIYGYLYVR
jgi:hypothetical protein